MSGYFPGSISLIEQLDSEFGSRVCCIVSMAPSV